MKNESKNRSRTLKTTPTGEPRPPRHRKTKHSKHTMLWMKTNAYEPTTVKRVAKELRHL
jgi:hypothetical protein